MDFYKRIGQDDFRNRIALNYYKLRETDFKIKRLYMKLNNEKTDTTALYSKLNR